MLKPLEGSLFRSSRFVRRRILSMGSAICCPSVTMVVPNIPMPLFREGLKSNLDWEAWERVSRLQGSFLYDPLVLMYHRIHEGSETTALIKDNTRTEEDLFMFESSGRVLLPVCWERHTSLVRGVMDRFSDLGKWLLTVQ